MQKDDVCAFTVVLIENFRFYSSSLSTNYYVYRSWIKLFRNYLESNGYVGNRTYCCWGQEPKSTLCSAKLYNLWVCFVSAKRKIYEQKPKATYRINFLRFGVWYFNNYYSILRKVSGIWSKFEWLIQRSRKIICNKNHLDIRSFKDKGTGNVYQKIYK